MINLNIDGRRCRPLIITCWFNFLCSFRGILLLLFCQTQNKRVRFGKRTIRVQKRVFVELSVKWWTDEVKVVEGM
jgi:hypothetical protein